MDVSGGGGAEPKEIATDDEAKTPDRAVELYNLGVKFHTARGFEQAVRIYREAIALRPAFLAPRVNLANALVGLGLLAEAVEEYRACLVLKSDCHPAHRGLATALEMLGRRGEALTHRHAAAAAAPGKPEAQAELGNALFALDKFKEAEAAYRSAIALEPDYHDAFHNLGTALMRQYQWDKALEQFLTSWRHNPTPLCSENILKCLLQIGSPPDSVELRGIMTAEVAASRYRLDQLQVPASRLLRAGEPLKTMLARVGEAWPRRMGREALTGGEGFAALGEDGLLLPLLESTTICSLDFERFFTTLRRILLDEAVAESPESDLKDLPLFAALARQCFINEYIYDVTAGEDDVVSALTASAERTLRAGRSLSPLKVVAIAAYTPLCSTPLATELVSLTWPDCVSALIVQQVTEPLTERALREKIPSIGDIGDAISVKVRAQYEENPYPRWVRVPPKGKTYEVNSFLREFLPDSSFKPHRVEGAWQVLIAGCGTGRHPIGAANRFENCDVVAVDLSLSSLCYARRKAEEIGVPNLTFVHGDILSLGGIGRTFDVVESMGVLHHMDDPMAGWRVLASLLKDGGFMAIGLYSELARKGVVKARELIAEKGYLSDRGDMRKCRQELISMAGDPHIAKLIGLRDFFGTSECRDMIFHVKEHRFTFPMIKRALGELGLDFLGLYLPLGVRRAYGERFPDDPTMTNLDNWHLYESDHPDTFVGMYQFWVQKRG